jgi:hypothetical protein
VAGPRLSRTRKASAAPPKAAAQKAPAKKQAAAKKKAPAKQQAPAKPKASASRRPSAPPVKRPPTAGSAKKPKAKAPVVRGAEADLRPSAQSLLLEAQRDGLALVQVATVARPLGSGAVDVAALGAGAFLTIGPRSEVPLLVATAIAAWAVRAAPAGILVVLDQGLAESEAAFSALASKLGQEVRVRQWEALELDAPNLARLATVDRAARRAFLTSLHLPLAQTTPIRIDPLALDDAASQRPVQLEREAHGFRVRPGPRARVLSNRKD